MSLPNNDHSKPPNHWTENTCNLCQVICETENEKDEHINVAVHVKRSNIYEFLNKRNFTASSKPSAIHRRYTTCEDQAIGVECIYELIFPWCESGWWACTLCYETGSTYEQLDDHLLGKRHLSIYINELHPELKFLDGNADVNEFMAMKRKIFTDEQNSLILPPEVYELSLPKEEAWIELVVMDKDPPYSIHKRKDSTQFAVISCNICHEFMPCRRSNVHQERAWKVHSLSPFHRAALTLNSVLPFCHPSEVFDETPAEDGPYKWKINDGCAIGPVCGIKHLVVFGRQSYCSLCFCVVESLEEHFSSEAHILKFACSVNASEGFDLTQCSTEHRREKLLSLLSKDTLGNDFSRECTVNAIPEIIREIANNITLQTPENQPVVESIGLDTQGMFCPVCWKWVILADMNDSSKVWDEHIYSEDHFIFACKRNMYMYDDAFFVSLASSITLPPKNMKGSWANVPSKSEKTGSLFVQDHADIGLEYVIEDYENKEIVCTLCAEKLANDNNDVAIHVRGLPHLLHYLHVTNRHLLSLILAKADEESVLETTLDWMHRIPATNTDIRVYSISHAKKLDNCGKVSLRTIDSSSFDSSHRPVYETLFTTIDKVADDDVEKQAIPMRDALLLSGIRIIDWSETNGKVEMVCRCMQCEVVFATKNETILEDVWNGHFQTDEHFRRLTAFAACKMDGHGFTDSPSTYTVKPMDQKDPQKKITWHWNPVEKVHEFVLSVVGLEDIVERKSLEGLHHNGDFFCTVCAVTFQRKAHILEAHVRCTSHVYCYVHKHFPMTVKKIESLAKTDGGKMMRKELAQLLKNIRPATLYCMPVYDPVGEKERKGIVAMQKAAELERQRKLAEERKKAEIRRKQMDLERRQKREQELERQRKAHMEMERKEKEAREREVAREKEKERLRAIAMAKKKELEDKQRLVEEEKERIRKKEKEKLREILEREKKRLVELKEKKKQLELLEEQKRLQKELDEVRARHAQRKEALAPSNVLIPQPQLVIPTSIDSFNQFSAVPPPNYSMVAPPSAFQYQQLPTQGISSSMINLPSMGSAWNISGVSRTSLMNTKVDPYILDPMIIHTREQLIDFIWRQGTVQIPASELPNRFSSYANKTEGLLGLDAIFEVVCIDDPKLDTFYCSTCNFWNLPNELFKHMETNGHRLAYLYRNCKAYHAAVMSETNITVRNAMLEQFAIQIWKTEQPLPVVTHRLRSVLNKDAIGRLWPDYVSVVDHKWKRDPRAGSPLPLSPRSSPLRNDVPTSSSSKVTNKQDDVEGVPMNTDDDIICLEDDKKKKETAPKEKKVRKDKEKSEKTKLERKKSPSPKKRKASRSRSRSRDRKRVKDSDRKRSSSRDRRRRSTSRDRKRSRSRDRRSREKRSRDRRSRDRQDRDRKRSRSRSRDRKVTSSSSTKAPLSSILSGPVPGAALSWEQSAAAFLAKIGDHQAASKVLDDRRRRRRSHSRRSRSRSRSRTSERRRNDSNSMDSLPATTLPLPTKDFVENTKISAPLASTPQKSEPMQPADPNNQLRKMLGLIVTMQQEAEKRGGLDDTVVNKLYGEMGLTRNESSENDSLMAQLCSLISGQSDKPKTSLDLSKFGISKESQPIKQTAPNSYDPSSQAGYANVPGHSNVPQSSAYGQNSSNLYGIRKEIPSSSYQDSPSYATPSSTNAPPSSSAAMSNISSLLSGLKGTLDALKKRREASPPPLPTSNLVINRTEDLYANQEEFSYVYPDMDREEEKRNNYEQHPEDNARKLDVHSGQAIHDADDDDLWDQDQYGRRRNTPSSMPNRPAPNRPIQRPPVHPSQAYMQEGYEPVFPTARVGMRQNNAGEARNRNQPAMNHGGPKPPFDIPKDYWNLAKPMRRVIRKKLLDIGVVPEHYLPPHPNNASKEKPAGSGWPGGQRPHPHMSGAQPGPFGNRSGPEQRMGVHKLPIEPLDDDIQVLETPEKSTRASNNAVPGTSKHAQGQNRTNTRQMSTEDIDEWEKLESELGKMLNTEKSKLESTSLEPPRSAPIQSKPKEQPQPTKPIKPISKPLQAASKPTAHGQQFPSQPAVPPFIQQQIYNQPPMFNQNPPFGMDMTRAPPPPPPPAPVMMQSYQDPYAPYGYDQFGQPYQYPPGYSNPGFYPQGNSGPNQFYGGGPGFY